MRWVGIEVTEYQVCRTGAGSPARQASTVGQLVLDSLYQHISNRQEFWPFLGDLSFHLRNPPRSRDVKQCVDELLAFLESKLQELPRKVMERKIFTGMSGDFRQFPHLNRHLERLEVTRFDPAPLEPHRWGMSQASNIGIDPRSLAEIISRKGGKKQSYDLTEVDECWLLICATGDTVHDRGGPDFLSRSALSEPAVCRAARESGFDRVFFWERVLGWDFEIPQHDAGAKRV